MITTVLIKWCSIVVVFIYYTNEEALSTQRRRHQKTRLTGRSADEFTRRRQMFCKLRAGNSNKQRREIKR